MPNNLSPFVTSYLETALWSSNDESDDSGGEPLDKNYDISDIAEKTIAQAIKDCQEFQSVNHILLVKNGATDDADGHNFWLSRNGHGAGFFDAGTKVGDKLQDAAHKFRELYPIVGDDGLIYFE
jgi:hypothetical protein